jgi:xanthine/uracil permease
MTGENLDPYLGRALFADGFGTALSSAVGGSPTTTYAENIGVMAATRVYSTAAYYVVIGLLGAKIWVENRVDFGNPVNLVPMAAAIIIGVGNVSMPFGDDFELSGIALGSIVAIVAYHLARLVAPRTLREP